MGAPRRVALALLALPFELLALGVVAVALPLLLSLPRLDGTVAVTGLREPVLVERDAFGIPTIRAANERDLYFGLGFVHAQDRLWQMEFHRRLGQGRLAEILGPAALPSDRLMRTLGLYRRAEADVAALDPSARELVEAYVAGVNAAIAARAVLPPEFLIFGLRPEPWRPADTLVWARVMALDLENDWQRELLRARLLGALGPERYADLWPSPAIRQAEAGGAAAFAALAEALSDLGRDGGASNGWVVAGERTASGAPLLANDPHLRLQMPGLWYLVRLRTPTLAVSGATLPPLGAVVIGRNREIAWGFTATGADTQDLFLEELDAEGRRYRTADGWAELERRTETLAVRDGTPVTMEVRATRHGPLISDLAPGLAELAGPRRGLALAWTALRGPDRSVSAGLALARARDWGEARAALERFDAPVQNLLFADRKGRIALRVVGRVPRRGRGDGTLPVPGWDPAYDWRGILPFEALPEYLDPPSGRLVNANERIGDGNEGTRLARFWPPPLRADRIRALLDATAPLTVADMARIQLDIRSGLFPLFRDWLLAARPRDRGARELWDALAAWDGRMDPTRPEPLVFAAWYRALAETVYADELGDLFAAYRDIRADFLRRVWTVRPVWCDDVRTPAVEDCVEASRRAFAAALDEPRARWGEDWRRWRWGRAHPARLAHPLLDGVPLLGRLFGWSPASPGGATTVNVARWRPARPFAAVHGPGLRLVADLASPETALAVIAGGQSEHPFSPHYDDLARRWLAGELVALGDASAAPPRHVLLLRPTPVDNYELKP